LRVPQKIRNRWQIWRPDSSDPECPASWSIIGRHKTNTVDPKAINSKTGSLGSELTLSRLDETAGREEQISEIIARYLDARDVGNEQRAEEILARHPEFEKELKEFFENESFV